MHTIIWNCEIVFKFGLCPNTAVDAYALLKMKYLKYFCFRASSTRLHALIQIFFLYVYLFCILL